MNKGIQLGFGVVGITAYIPNKGFIHYDCLTLEDFKKLRV